MTTRAQRGQRQKEIAGLLWDNRGCVVTASEVAVCSGLFHGQTYNILSTISQRMPELLQKSGRSSWEILTPKKYGTKVACLNAFEKASQKQREKNAKLKKGNVVTTTKPVTGLKLKPLIKPQEQMPLDFDPIDMVKDETIEVTPPPAPAGVTRDEVIEIVKELLAGNTLDYKVTVGFIPKI